MCSSDLSLGEQTPQAGLQPGTNLLEVSGDECAHADGHALPPQLEPPSQPVREHGQRADRQAVEENHRAVRDVTERFAGGRHFLFTLKKQSKPQMDTDAHR